MIIFITASKNNLLASGGEIKCVSGVSSTITEENKKSVEICLTEKSQ